MNPDLDDSKNIGQQHWDNLVGAESSASQQKSSDNPDLDSSKIDDTPSNQISVNLSSNNQQGSSKQKKGFKGFMRKKLPTLLIILALAGGGGAILGSQSMQGFAIVNRIIQEFNSMGTVSSVRSNVFLHRILKGSSTKTGTVFDDENFKLGDTEVANLKSNDIDLVDNGDGTRSMNFKNGGETYTITGDNFDAAKADVPDFDNKLTAGTATYSQQNTGWYDKLTQKFLSKLGLGRNRFNNYEQTGDAEADDAKFKEIAETDKQARGSKDQSTRQFEEEVEDDDGESFKEKGAYNGEINPDEEMPVKTDTETEIESKLKTKANAIVGGAVGFASQSCQIMTIASTINDIANAAELIQVLNFANGFIESVQKVQAGIGSKAPMGNYLTRLNKYDSTTGKTGMQSSGMKQLFGGIFDRSEKSAQELNFESSHHKLFNEIPLEGMSGDDFKKCSYAMAADGAFAGAESIAFALGMSNPATAPVTIGAALVGVAQKAILMGTVQIIVEALAPRVASLITRSLIADDTLGPILGNALSIRNYLSTNHKQRGGSGGDEKAVAAFNQEVNKAIAHQAKYERETKSPFDATSQYTFLGSLYNSLLPIASESNSFLGMLSSLSSTTLSSIGKVLPSVSAANLENTHLTSTRGDCPISDEFDVVSDEFCSPIMTSDVSTMNMDPADVYNIVKGLDGGNNFQGETDNKNPKINLNSNLGKYLVFCGQRQVNYGYADASAATNVSFSNVGTSNTETVYNSNVNDPKFNIPLSGEESKASRYKEDGNSIIKTITNFFSRIFRVSGDAAFDAVEDVINGLTNAANAEWISGRNCVNTDKNPHWDNEMKYYQRYLEDQGIMEAMGIVDKSSLEIALDEWYEENPIDNSYEGLLAYFSGHTKEDVQLALDYIDYQDAIAKYHPEKMAPLSPEEEPSGILFDADNFAFIEMNQPLISRAAEFQSEIALREDKRAIYQSI